MGHRDDGVSAILVFERGQQGELALLSGPRRRLVDLRHEVKPGGFTLDRAFNIGKGVPGVTVARPLHQVVHKGRNALRAVKPCFREALTIKVSNVPVTHGQPRVEFLGEPSGQEAGQHEVEQGIAELQPFRQRCSTW